MMIFGELIVKLLCEITKKTPDFAQNKVISSNSSFLPHPARQLEFTKKFYKNMSQFICPQQKF
jgi:hypothetical protein